MKPENYGARIEIRDGDICFETDGRRLNLLIDNGDDDEGRRTFVSLSQREAMELSSSIVGWDKLIREGEFHRDSSF